MAETHMKAEVVYERQDAFDMSAGPYGYERVGFKIGNRVWWVGICGSGLPGKEYEADRELATQIVKRWNEGDPHHG